MSMPMPMPIAGSTTRIDALNDGLGVAPSETTKSAGANFGDALVGAFEKAGSLERTAADASTQFAAGDPNVGIHEVMLAAEKANIGVRYAVTLKNRVLEAYRELMQTPL